jgi:hypothetical protein
MAFYNFKSGESQQEKCHESHVVFAICCLGAHNKSCAYGLPPETEHDYQTCVSAHFRKNIRRISHDNFSKFIDGKNCDCHLLLLWSVRLSLVSIATRNLDNVHHFYIRTLSFPTEKSGAEAVICQTLREGRFSWLRM